MGFRCGLVGLPNVGKSTIFNALTGQSVEASAYPFCTIDPNVGIVPVADERLAQIQKLMASAKATPTTLEFVDIAGLVKGAHQGEGLGNQFLSHIQAMDALAHVVRCFVDENVAHVDADLNPLRDAEIVNYEILLKDLEIIEKRIQKIEKAARTGDKERKVELEVLKAAQAVISQGTPLQQLDIDKNRYQHLQALNLLTLKPLFYIANVDETHLEKNEYFQQLAVFAKQSNQFCLQFCGKAQAEISQLDPESQIAFLEEMGLDELGLQKIIKTGYRLLDLITFFTANENEAHAWTIPQNTTVQKAAGKIHTDFEKKFIRAEVMKYNDLIEFQSRSKLHELGLVAVHGKDYRVQDGDIVLFKI